MSGSASRSPPKFVPERTFGTLPAAMRYFAQLPRTPLDAARHLLTVHEFPEALAERDPRSAL